MKRLKLLFCALLISWSSSSIAETNAYGVFKILGFGGGTTDSIVVVFASYSYFGYQPEYCAQTDWWWPAGTTHTFWFDKTDMTTYTAFLTAYGTGKNMFISGYVDPKNFGLGAKCRVWQYSFR
jgi:hypothetical protein